MKCKARINLKRCNGAMNPGIATGQTWRRYADFIGDDPRSGVTMSPGGPGKIVQGMKCVRCGHTISR